MMITKFNSESINLLIDENEEIKEIKSYTYVLTLKNQEEYNKGAVLLINKALLHDINVYQYASNAFRLEYICERILSSHDLIIVFETHDESKFEILENTIKEFMIMHKDILN